MLQHLEICKMMSHNLVIFKKVRFTGDFLTIPHLNTRPDGTDQLATVPGKFIVLFVVIGASLMGSTVAPNAPSTFAILALEKNI